MVVKHIHTTDKDYEKHLIAIDKACIQQLRLMREEQQRTSEVPIPKFEESAL